MILVGNDRTPDAPARSPVESATPTVAGTGPQMKVEIEPPSPGGLEPLMLVATLPLMLVATLPPMLVAMIARAPPAL